MKSYLKTFILLSIYLTFTLTQDSDEGDEEEVDLCTISASDRSSYNISPDEYCTAENPVSCRYNWSDSGSHTADINKESCKESYEKCFPYINSNFEDMAPVSCDYADNRHRCVTGECTSHPAFCPKNSEGG